MPPHSADVFIMDAWHWIWAIMISGGGAGVFIAYWLNRKKNPDRRKQAHDDLVAVVEAHKEEDLQKFQDGLKRFDEVNHHLEKQYDMLIGVSTDIGKIKGKLGID